VYAVSGLDTGVGASSLAVNLARALRELQGPVLLVELDVEHPGLREKMELPPGDGVEAFLRGARTLEEVVHKDAAGRVDALFCGGEGRPGDLSSLRAILPGLREDYAIIVVDTGPIRGDLALLAAQQADGVVLVAKWKASRYGQLRAAIDRLVHQETTAVTAVLNQVPRPEEAPVQAFFAALTGWISRTAGRILPGKIKRTSS
jgi:receptor protein-tyrosine kinase